MDMISEAAIFHLETAARKFKNIKAMTILGTKLLGQDTDELEDLELPKVRLPFFPLILNFCDANSRMLMLDGP